jgi:DsbC/DsbD-like thiol-disulfide interchange protein
MKRILLTLFCCGVFGVSTYAQHPVKWNFYVKKIKGEQYILHLQARMDSGWHIYSQEQPKDAVAVPTVICFAKQAGIVLLGDIQEIGKRELNTIEELGLSNYQYSEQVEFVKRVKASRNIKMVSGSITFQSCTERECLPPETVQFSINLPK